MAAVAAVAGWNAAQAETWQQRLDALEAGAPTKLDLGTPQLAQETESEEPIMLDPVTVEGQGENATGPVDGYVANESTTGSKTDTPIIENPQSISVISADRLDAQAAGSLAEALRYSAGVTGELFGMDQRGYGINIRGFETDEGGFYRDGLQLKGTSFSAFLPLDLYGAERLEIMRGPASVLYGQNPPGGLINYVSKRPTAEPFHEVEASAGTFDRFEGKFDLSGPITEEGDLLYRVTGLARDSDTQVDFVNDDRYFIAPALTWAGEDTTLTLLANYQHDNAGWGIQFLPASGTVLDNPNGRLPRHTFTGEPDFDRYNLDQASFGYLFEHRFNDVFTVRQNARVSYLHNDSDVVYGNGLIDDRTLARIGDVGKSEMLAFTVDNQAEAKFETGPIDHTALLGRRLPASSLQRLRRHVRYCAARHLRSRLRRGAFQQAGLRGQQDQAAPDRHLRPGAGQAVRQAGDRAGRPLRLRASEFEDKRLRRDPESDQGQRLHRPRRPRLSVRQRACALFQLFGVLRTELETDADGNPFKPEEGRQYEVGIKYQPPGWNSFVTLSLFDLVKQNVLTPDPAGPAQQPGADRRDPLARRRARGRRRASTSASTLLLAYAFIDAEITKSNADGGGRQPAGPTPSTALRCGRTIRSRRVTSPGSASAPACATSARASATTSRT